MQTPSGAPAIACVLVNWNQWEDTAACLASLRRQSYAALTVVVVDNGSTDNSLAQLRAAHPWAIYLPSPDNLGFPRACNLGARHPSVAATPLIWFLNNDTVAPPDTAALLAAGMAQPNVGLVGTVLRYLHQPQTIQAWGGGTISRWTAFNRHVTQPVPFGPDFYLTFASVLVRRAVFDQLGGLYEGAFMYFEDADFSLRAHQAGWDFTVADGTAVLHKEGASLASVSATKDRLTTLAGLHFLTRHSPAPALSRTLFLLSRVVKRLLLLRPGSVRTVLQAAAEFRHSPSPEPNRADVPGPGPA